MLGSSPSSNTSLTPMDRYDPTVRVLLSANFDLFVDSYNLGFWNNGPVSLLTSDTLSC